MFKKCVFFIFSHGSLWPQIVTIMFLWLAFTLGCFILYNLFDYMNNKPPGQQTLLDVLYSQMLILYIAIGLIFSINFTLQEVEHRSMISTMLVEYGSSTLVLWSTSPFVVHLDLSWYTSLRTSMMFRTKRLKSGFGKWYSPYILCSIL